MATATKAKISPKSESSAHLTLTDVSVRYLLLLEEQRSLKGRLLGRLGRLTGRPPESPEFWALRNVSIGVRPGDRLGLIGRNGSGKSSLLKVMARIITPASGTVDSQGSVSPLLELGGAFSPELTGRENAYLYGAINRISRSEMKDLMPKIITFSELGRFFDVPLKCYSSGMVSRLAFSVATEIRPDILLVDEVLAVGDEAFQKKCLIRINKMVDRGAILVMVAHSAGLIEHFCNRVMYLSKGEVISEGRPKVVLAQYQRDTALTG
jgi:ABC-type polysaccharide/polyol phosphate transport system ATPase subunit